MKYIDCHRCKNANTRACTGCEQKDPSSIPSKFMLRAEPNETESEQANKKSENTGKYVTTHEGDTINVNIRRSSVSGWPTIVIDVNGQKVGLSLLQLNSLGLFLGVIE